MNINKYEIVADTLTSSLVPVRPFTDSPGEPITKEIAEFVPDEAQYAHPYTSYVNHVYVYPKSLKYDGQRVFPKVCQFNRVFFSYLLEW